MSEEQTAEESRQPASSLEESSWQVVDTPKNEENDYNDSLWEGLFGLPMESENNNNAKLQRIPLTGVKIEVRRGLGLFLGIIVVGNKWSATSP